MNNSNGGDHAKRRRVDDDGVESSSIIGQEKDRGDGLPDRDLMSVMKQLLEHSRSQTASMARQTESMASLQEEMKCVKEEMGKIQRELQTTKEEVKDMRVAMNSMSDKCDRMERLLQSRFDRVENKQNYQEVFLKNQKWEYSATLPPEDSVAYSVQYFLKNIKRITCDIRHGNGDAADGEIEIYTNSDVPYEADFLPHWEEFCDALQEYRYTLRCLPKDESSSLYLNGMELSPTMIERLSNALESTHFKSFGFGNNPSFGQEGVNFALRYLFDNPILEHFKLNHNTLVSNDNIASMCDIIKDHHSIHTLELDGCCGNGMNGHDVLRSIATAGKNKLKRLDMASNGISTMGSTFIADCT